MKNLRVANSCNNCCWSGGAVDGFIDCMIDVNEEEVYPITKSDYVCDSFKTEEDMHKENNRKLSEDPAMTQISEGVWAKKI